MPKWAEVPGIILVGHSQGPKVRVGANSAPADTLDAVLDYCPIPAGLWREHSQLISWCMWDYPSNGALTKTLIPRFGAGSGVPAAAAGGSMGQAAPTTGVSSAFSNMLFNAGTLNQQYGVNGTAPWSAVGSGNAKISMTVDTSQDTFVAFNAKWSGAANETLTLLKWFVWLIP